MFHHGRKVTAHDVAYSGIRLLAHQTRLSVTEIYCSFEGARECMQGKTYLLEELKLIDRYILQLVREAPSVAGGEFLQGKLEETMVPSTTAEEVHVPPSFQYLQVHISTPSLCYIGFNTLRELFANPRWRWAFNYAVDRASIVREVTNMGSVPATGALPPRMLGDDPDRHGYAYDPETAKQRLAESGYPHEAEFPIVHLWLNDTVDSLTAKLAASERYPVELGAQAQIHHTPDWPTFQSMLEQGQCPMFRLSWYADIPDLDNFLSPLILSTSRTNCTFYGKLLADQVLEQARRECDENRRIALYREQEHLVMGGCPAEYSAPLRRRLPIPALRTRSGDQFAGPVYHSSE